MRLSSRSMLTLTLCTLFMASVRLTAPPAPALGLVSAFVLSEGVLSSAVLSVCAVSATPSGNNTTSLTSETFAIFVFAESISFMVENTTLKSKSNFSSSKSSTDGTVFMISPISEMFRITRVERAAFKRQPSSRNIFAIITFAPSFCAVSIADCSSLLKSISIGAVGDSVTGSATDSATTSDISSSEADCSFSFLDGVATAHSSAIISLSWH